jgi:adenylate cyclase
MSRQQEVERKFRVHAELLPPLPPGSRLAQGYLAREPVVRVRTEEGPSGARSGFLTIKGEGLIGRDEFEYSIPWEEATALLRLARGVVIQKTRHRLPVEGAPELCWELDVFSDENEGLIIAEVELPDAEHPFPRPAWLDDEVSHDSAYQNVRLSERPFREWGR